MAGYSLLMASLSLHPLENANSSLHQSIVDSESIEGRICTCENQTDLKTSRTNTNPATRFFICGQQENRSGEILCFGPSMCDWSKKVAHGLLRLMRGLVKVNELQLHVKGMEAEIQRLEGRIKMLEAQMRRLVLQSKFFEEKLKVKTGLKTSTYFFWIGLLVALFIAWVFWF
ncbi:uncharacterized protein LOC111376422 isoform X2 [Olea europaea var. sylvestris]|uniref:uncharacterized protein LOC111376422 isoform X2 n=1 Tax=Olea europaea var. sylvestris TaxID=158386 RepID=UPI000C1D41C8|nr:uncharacterized protein LOC111376422 isoform X2 [Olea europaea var. sylvestris]